MWCIQCQADVAAEMAPDNRQILCASCGSRIRTVPVLPTEDKTRQARELLSRWSQSRWSDEEAPQSSNTEPADPAAAGQDPAGSTFRVDDPDSGQSDQVAPATSRQDPRPRQDFHSQAVPLPPAAPQRLPVQKRTHEPQNTAYPPPHFPGEPNWESEPPIANSSSTLQSFWGQMLAYAGILALTIGAAFVLLGYFGGPQWQSYTPTGWLITITGQMLLFLGVVTLVSGGMEQTTETVARRIDALGQRILRIEWASKDHALKGPSLPAEQFQPRDEHPPGDDSAKTPGEHAVSQA